MHNNRTRLRAEKLKAYSAAAALLAVTGEVSAEVVYNGLDPDIQVNPGDTAYLDLDGDGTNDLMFWINSVQGSISTAEGGLFNYTYRFAYASGLDNNVIFGEPGSSAGYEFLMPYNFSSGQAIEDTLTNFFAPARLAALVQLDGIPFYSGGPWDGLTGIMGVRFKIGDESHFAWIRLSVATAATGITIAEYAWDNQTDAGITAGITSNADNLSDHDQVAIWSSGAELHISTGDATASVNLRLYDMAGRLVWNDIVSGDRIRMLPAVDKDGIYLAEVLWNDKRYSRSVYLSGQ